MGNFFSERAKQIKSGEFSVNTSSAASPNAPVKPIKINKWDQEIHPKIEEYGLQKNGVSYETTKFMRNVYNGKYDEVAAEMQKTNPSIYGKIQKLKESSNAFTQELRKTKPDLNKALDYYNASQENSLLLFNAFSDANSKDGAYKISEKNGSILKAKSYNKQNQNYESFSDINSTDIRVEKTSSTAGWILGGIGSIVTSIVGDENIKNENLRTQEVGQAYDFLKGKDAEAMSALKIVKNRKTSMWLEEALNGAEGNTNSKATYNSVLLSMGKELLERVSRYGTKSDPELRAKHQKQATDLLKQFNSFEDTKEGVAKQVNFLIRNNEFLKDANSQLGYYETSYLFRKYQKDVSKNDLFINKGLSSKGRSTYLDELKWIEKFEGIYDKYRENAGTIKKNTIQSILDGKVGKMKSPFLSDAADLAGNAYKDAVAAITDEDGDVVSYKKFVDKIYPSISKMPISLTVIGSSGTVNYDEAYRKESAKNLHKHLEGLYKNLSKGYKQTLDTRKTQLDHDASLLSQGIGSTSRRGIGFSSVNLSTDEEGRLKSFSGPKQKNVLDIWNLIRNPDGTFGNAAATILPASSKEELINLNTLDKPTLMELSKNSDTEMRNFLKSNPEDVKLVFLRDSNIKGYAQYRLYNNETKKSVVAMIRHSELRNVKEPMFQASRQTIDEINFAMENKKQLIPVTDSRNRVILMNPYFTWDKNTRLHLLHGKHKDIVLGKNSDKFYAPAGSSIEESTKYFDALMTQMKDNL